MSRSSFRRAALAASTAAWTLLAGPAAAQSINYGSLQTLFGEPVTMSATGKPQRASEVPVAMDIITQEQIRRSGLTNLPEIIARLVGVDSWYDGPQSTSFEIRGFSTSMPQRLLVLVNGRQVYTDIFNNAPWPAVPVQPHEIRQIEVVRGPNSALFGLNAVAGVINIVTFNPLHDQVNSATVRVGTHDHREASAVVTLPFGSKGGLRLSAGTVTSDTFDSIKNSRISGPIEDEPERQAVLADGMYQIAPGVQLGAEVSWAKSRQNDRDPNARYAVNAFKVKSIKTNLLADTDLGLTEASLYRNTWAWDIEVGGPLARLSPFGYDQEVTVAQVEHLIKPSPAHTLRLAAEYRDNEAQLDGTDYNATGLFKVPGTGLAVQLYGGSVMWDWAITDRLSVNNAVRIDHVETERFGPQPTRPDLTSAAFTRSITEWSFNSGATYRLGDQDTLRVNASRGVQLPSLFTLGMLHFRLPAGPGLDIVGSGDPTVQPSILMNYEAGWTRKLPGIGGELAVSAFYQTFEDIVDNLPTQLRFAPNGRPFLLVSYGNIGKADAYGLEAELSGSFGKGWTWGVNYTWLLVNDDFNRLGNVNAAKQANRIGFEGQNAEHTANARLGWTSGDWTVDLYAQYRSETTRFTTDRAIVTEQPAYLVFDGRVAYRINDIVTVEISGQSLNRAGFESAHAFDYERRLFLGVTADF